MVQQCFSKPGSNPPTCGIHNMPLQPTNTSDPDPNVKFYVCPASGQTIKDAATQS